MSSTYSIDRAKNFVGRLVCEAESGKRVELTRRGKPVAGVVSTAELARVDSERRDFWRSYQGFRARFEIHELGIDPTETFSAAADRSPSRDFSWWCRPS